MSVLIVGVPYRGTSHTFLDVLIIKGTTVDGEILPVGWAVHGSYQNIDYLKLYQLVMACWFKADAFLTLF